MLTRTGTVPSRVIHALKEGNYTHTSISLEPRTDRFFSYARRRLNNTLIAGFVVENIHTGVFARYPKCQCKVFSIEISDESYENIQKQIEIHMELYEKSTYNILGMLTSIFGSSVTRPLKHTCSQFVATLLEKSSAVKLPKKPRAMLPNDFNKLENISVVYEGLLNECVIPK